MLERAENDNDRRRTIVRHKNYRDETFAYGTSRTPRISVEVEKVFLLWVFWRTRVAACR